MVPQPGYRPPNGKVALTLFGELTGRTATLSIKAGGGPGIIWVC